MINETDENRLSSAEDLLVIYMLFVIMIFVCINCIDVYKNAYKFIYTKMYSNKMEVHSIRCNISNTISPIEIILVKIRKQL